MNQARRIFVEKKPNFRVEAETLKNELNGNLGLGLKSLRLLNVYDLFGFSDELMEKSRYSVFGEVVTDMVSDGCDLSGRKYLAIEYLPGQFDQRAASALACTKLLDPNAEISIKSAKLLIFDDDLSDNALEKIGHYCINAVECRRKDLSVLAQTENAEVKPVMVLEDFREMSDLSGFCSRMGLAMNADDLAEVIRYFKAEGRDPNETELRILDTYWSDHCRHTTFTSELQSIKIDKSFISSDIEDSLSRLNEVRKELERESKPLCLMELATIGARYLSAKGLLDDMERSEENNACSIYIDVDVNGEMQKWLLMFKNETHNHPTEIEPFGGASTCLGGAIRDPLSGRSYVYQAMRVTGAGDIYQPVSQTLAGKLPQWVISTKAAAGYSSYGNQIGLATGHVREIYHDGYIAKRLEVGAVVGAVKADAVRRESPKAGDVILMLGGRTGRDGIGGATGSSKEHNEKSLEECGSEVQKGNAPEERKLQRLFRRKEVVRLIKKSNDFGAGGVSVAIGELAPGLDIYLDRVKVKYSGLNATELAISESQERMAVVVELADMQEIMAYCREENLEVVHVADVTDGSRMRMFYNGKIVADLSRDFIDSAGARHYASARIASVDEKNPFDESNRDVLSIMKDANVQSQRGLIEMFDSTIGASTVLMPFGGKTQRSETQVSVQKLPVGKGFTNTASIMAFGYDPYLSTWSPYHGAAYAVVDACAKVVAAGARYDKMRFSYQEYFERMHNEVSWGKPLASLLGALKMQLDLGLPSIGGKDSMSGSFKDINVPPMLMAFGITTVDARNVISPEFKKEGHKIYIVRHKPLPNYMPDTEGLKSNFNFVSDAIAKGKIVAAHAVGFGGVCEAISKMAFGNNIGAKVQMDDLYDKLYGSIVVEANEDLDYPNAELVGSTTAEPSIDFNGKSFTISELYAANTQKFASIYPDIPAAYDKPKSELEAKPVASKQGVKPRVYIPVFPGTNCDYDTAKAFRREGAAIDTNVFCDLTAEDIFASIKRMKSSIDKCDILVFSGGFSAGDEPDGSGKFIANILNNSEIAASVHALLDRGGLILGICNGFQALIKSGLLPYGRLGMLTEDSPTLFRNDINRHISRMTTCRVESVNSPWLKGFQKGDEHVIAISHGEGKFVASHEMEAQLFENGQVAFTYLDNPNGSTGNIEGIISKDGQILGKMGHSERYEPGLYKNIPGNKCQNIFKNAIDYFNHN